MCDSYLTVDEYRAYLESEAERIAFLLYELQFLDDNLGEPREEEVGGVVAHMELRGSELKEPSQKYDMIVATEEPPAEDTEASLEAEPSHDEVTNDAESVDDSSEVSETPEPVEPVRSEDTVIELPMLMSLNEDDTETLREMRTVLAVVNDPSEIAAQGSSPSFTEEEAVQDVVQAATVELDEVSVPSEVAEGQRVAQAQSPTPVVPQPTTPSVTLLSYNPVPAVPYIDASILGEVPPPFELEQEQAGYYKYARLFIRGDEEVTIHPVEAEPRAPFDLSLIDMNEAQAKLAMQAKQYEDGEIVVEPFEAFDGWDGMLPLTVAQLHLLYYATRWGKLPETTTLPPGVPLPPTRPIGVSGEMTAEWFNDEELLQLNRVFLMYYRVSPVQMSRIMQAQYKLQQQRYIVKRLNELDADFASYPSLSDYDEESCPDLFNALAYVDIPLVEPINPAMFMEPVGESPDVSDIYVEPAWDSWNKYVLELMKEADAPSANWYYNAVSLWIRNANIKKFEERETRPDPKDEDFAHIQLGEMKW